MTREYMQFALHGKLTTMKQILHHFSIERVCSESLHGKLSTMKQILHHFSIERVFSESLHGKLTTSTPQLVTSNIQLPTT